MTIDADEGMWVIGYGSLIFKPPPHYSVKVSGYLKGFIRRFWQSSSDHRGTEQNPGRVVTLVSLEDLQSYDRFHGDLHTYELKGQVSNGENCSQNDIVDITHRVSQLTSDDLKVWGVAYYIEPENVAKVKNYLDIREQDGYSTHKIGFHVVNTFASEHEVINRLPQENGEHFIESMIYIGTIDNESFVGPESVEATAKVIKTSKGPSGPNSEYLIELTKAVRDLDSKNRSRDYYLEDLVLLIEN